MNVIDSVCDRVAADSDLTSAIASLVASSDSLKDFQGIATARPELAALILQASLASLVNTQSVMAISAELNRRTASN